jgi:hypothetical protein
MGKDVQPQEPGTRMLLQFCLSTVCIESIPILKANRANSENQCVKCISRTEPAPTKILEWCTKRERYLSETDRHAFPLINIISRFVNFYSAFKKGYSDAETVFEELLALEVELELWEAQVPEVWRFILEPTPEGAGESIFNGQSHVYRDLWSVILDHSSIWSIITDTYMFSRTARIYGHYRWARILINELIWVHISRTSSFSVEHELQQRRSLETISNMARDICCSVSNQFRRHKVEHFRGNKIPPSTQSS